MTVKAVGGTAAFCGAYLPSTKARGPLRLTACAKTLDKLKRAKCKSRNKVSVGEPAEGSLLIPSRIPRALSQTPSQRKGRGGSCLAASTYAGRAEKQAEVGKDLSLICSAC